MINILVLLLVFTGMGLPWMANYINASNWQKILGESFYIGVFKILVIYNIFQWLGLDINNSFLFYLCFAFSTVTTAYYIFVYKRTMINGVRERLNLKPHFSNIVVILAVFAFLHLIFIEIQNQSLPLFAWDAWYGWVAKAKIWYFYGINENLVGRVEWFSAKEALTSPIHHYPDGLSLLYVFNSGIFDWNETRLNAIYPAMFISFILLIYGNVKLITQSSYLAFGFVFVLVSLPYVNNHIILSGYADIWMAAYLFISFVNIQQYFITRQKRFLILSTLSLVSMLMFKLEAWVWVSIIILSVGLSCLSKFSQRRAYFILACVIAIWYLFGGISIGGLKITPEVIAVPWIGEFQLQFVNTTDAWLETFFVSNNWYFLWYLLLIVVIFSGKIKDRKLLALPGLLLVFSTIFLFVLFYMTQASVFANDFTSSNRVILQILPIYIYFIAIIISEYSKQLNSKKLEN